MRWKRILSTGLQIVIPIVIIWNILVLAWGVMLKSGCFDNTDNGSELSEVMDSLRRQEDENCAYFTDTGTKLLDRTSRHNDKVALPICACAALYRRKNTLSVHNHPVDITFSPDDLITDSLMKAKYSIVVTAHTTYIISSGGHWPSAFKIWRFFQDVDEDTTGTELSDLMCQFAETFDLEYDELDVNLIPSIEIAETLLD